MMRYRDPFKDKVCVITGGANGIGLCIAREFSALGAKVAIIDLDEAAGKACANALQQNGSDAVFFCGDIAEEQILNEFRDLVIERFGSVDYLINNACLSKRGIQSGCTYEEFNYVQRVGVAAPYQLTKLLLPYFKEGSSIINIASTRAFMSQADTESYTAAKGGILALTHALSVTLAGKVRVNSISPGWIDVSANFDENYVMSHSAADKDQHPVKRVGKPLDIARAVLFLCDPENSFITGENLTVDGGMTKQMIYHGDEGWILTTNDHGRG